MARKRVAAGRLPVAFLSKSGEQPLPLPSASVDTVVVTWTICSIPNVEQALQQMKRVLKPSGRLIFLEHGRSPDPSVVAWQDRLTPIWKRFTGGGHLNPQKEQILPPAVVPITEVKTGFLPQPPPLACNYPGFAQTRPEPPVAHTLPVP